MRKRLRRRVRPYAPLIWLFAGSLAISAAWVYVQGLAAVKELRLVQQDLVALQAGAGHPDPYGAMKDLTKDLDVQARAAKAHTGGLAWKVWSHAPVFGTALTVAAGVSSAAAELSHSAVPALLQASATIPQIRQPDGRLDLEPLHAQAQSLRGAVSSIRETRNRIEALPDTRFLNLRGSQQALVKQLDVFATRAQALAVVATVGPDVLGVDGPRRYLIIVQNNAESRASGGIVGAYGTIRFAGARATLEAFGSDSDLRQTTRNVVDFGTEWRARYDVLGAARDWREVTASPDFPTVAKTALALWAATHNDESLDGVLSVDPVALAYILEATGPLRGSGGGSIEASTFVQHSLSEAYRLYPEKTRRSAVLVEDARTVFRTLTSTGRDRGVALGERLGRGVVTGHLKFFAATAVIQNEIAKTTLAGALPVTSAPLLGVITQAANADKLSVYLRRKIRYERGPDKWTDLGDGAGSQAQQTGTLTVQLRNTAPVSGLPDYVAPAIDLSDGQPIKRGRMTVLISIYLGKSGLLQGATLKETPVAMASQTELGLAVFSTTVRLDPGETVVLKLRVQQPGHKGRPLTVVRQPLAVDDINIGDR